MNGKVVHWKKEPFDLYIGRNGGRYGISKERDARVENPFPVAEFGRNESIAKFERYARARLAIDMEFKARIMACHQRVLGCWCSPLDCHGAVILKLAADLHSENI